MNYDFIQNIVDNYSKFDREDQRYTIDVLDIPNSLLPALVKQLMALPEINELFEDACHAKLSEEMESAGLIQSQYPDNGEVYWSKVS